MSDKKTEPKYSGFKIKDKIRMFSCSENTNNFIEVGQGIIMGFGYSKGDNRTPTWADILWMERVKINCESTEKIRIESPCSYIKKY